MYDDVIVDEDKNISFGFQCAAMPAGELPAVSGNSAIVWAAAVAGADAIARKPIAAIAPMR